MFYGIVICSDDKLKGECLSIVDICTGIEPRVYKSIAELKTDQILINYLFIIVCDLNGEILEKIAHLENTTPGLTAIFYNHSLTVSDFPEVNRSPKVKMVIGEKRQEALKELILSLKQNYWRKIPYAQFNIDFDMLSPRMKKVMNIIETAAISKCNITNLASKLNLSPGYFSQEFKRETGKSFRRFMQDLIAFYENEIVSKINLPAKNISQILGYSELSSFSRSFKKRKGVSPSKYKKMVKS